MFKKIIKPVLVTLSCVAIIGIFNAYLFAPELQRQGGIVAYRGGGSPINYETLNKTGCTAISLKKSNINTVENTLEAVASSVAAGANVIHLNIQRTSDDQLVVFHDRTLDCATNGIGAVLKSSFEKLKSIDAGYGYTFDNELTFPFRGKGFRISKLEEFYKQFPNYEFWLNLKNNDVRSFAILHAYLSEKKHSSVIITSSKGIEWFKLNGSSLKLVSVDSIKKCGIDYLTIGWAGIVPESCRNTIFLIPPSMTNFFWGYPDRFAARLQEHGSDIYLWSKHESIAPSYTKVIKSGIGVVTSDLNFIRTTQANKHFN